MRNALVMALVVLVLSGRVMATGPVLTPDSSVIYLDEISGYEVGCNYRSGETVAFPIGWSGHFDDRTGIACHPITSQKGRRSFLLHPPWRGEMGTTYQRFTFVLPKATSIQLTGATAMQTSAVGKSDGVTFRILINDKTVLDAHRADDDWKPFSIDLTSYSGQVISLSFETDPGPNRDASFDFGLWGDRRLKLVGYHPKPVTHPPAPALDLRKMQSTQNGEVAPPSGFAGKKSVAMRGDAAILRYTGSDGTLEYTWRRPESDVDGAFGRLQLKARMAGDKPVEISLAEDARLDWTASAERTGSRWVTAPKGSASLVQTFQVGSETALVQVTATMVGKSLVMEISCDKPLARMMEAGSWRPRMRQTAVTTPYYGGRVRYLAHENLFVNAFLDWTSSNATLHQDNLAKYEALTDGTRNRLKERVVYTAAWCLPEVLPNIPNPRSPFIKHVGNRIVLDVWGGRFDDIAAKLETLHGYGIENCVVIIHDWQRSGYDNALPAHYPANERYGGDQAMKVLVATAKRLGYLISLHENYVDYYPNFEGYDANDISLTSNGEQALAWYNSGTKVQSFALKPNSIVKYARAQSPEIQRRYQPNADFLDVHSSVPPWFHVDARAGEDGAGRFQRVWDVHRQLWRFERDTYGGPVFGEGYNHWYWSGCLDGVEAQFGVGWAAEEGFRAPLAVDFDLLKIHPLQLNHGMGYYNRWWPASGWGPIPPMAVLDQYRMQEVIYGHAGFVGDHAWSSIPCAWLEHHLLSPVMERYANAQVAGISYLVNGSWVDSTAAAKANKWDQVRVRYAHGLTITANDSDKPITTGGIVLPKSGWVARGAGVTAFTALRGKTLVDYAETANSVFVNARRASDWDLAGLKRIRPGVAHFEQTRPRAFRVTYRWNVKDSLDKDYVCFVHFDRLDVIQFQQDHGPAKPTSKWRVGEVVEDGPYTINVPAGLTDGDYTWYIGLFETTAGRAHVQGLSDGNRRIKLGVLRVRDDGKTIAFDPEHDLGADSEALYSRNLNTSGGVVDFGSIRTDGSALVRQEGDRWVLRTYPRDRAMRIVLNTKRFPMPEAVTCTGGRAGAIKPKRNGDWWTLAVNGAEMYSWKAR